jgi:hypothetical protein
VRTFLRSSSFSFFASHVIKHSLSFVFSAMLFVSVSIYYSQLLFFRNVIHTQRSPIVNLGK